MRLKSCHFVKRTVLNAAALTAVVSLSLFGCFPTQGGTKPKNLEPLQSTIPGKGVTIYAAGDIADCRKKAMLTNGAAKTAQIIADGLSKDKNAAVLTMGDNTYPVGLLAEFTDCYDPTWGQFKDRTYPSPGNHEYYSPAAAGYYDYFGERAGPSRRGYYSFELGKWHIVSLNSNLQNLEHQQQLEWLSEDLKQNANRCSLAYWHHPLFSSGGHGNNARMASVWKILQAARTDVVLVSHDHDYERFAPQDADGNRDDAHGIREFVVGTGGAKLSPLLIRKPNSEIADNSTHGVLRMELKDKGYEWEFVPVEGGKFTDRGAALCH